MRRNRVLKRRDCNHTEIGARRRKHFKRDRHSAVVRFVRPFIDFVEAVGGGHERGMRSGTLNVTGIVGFGKACELAMHEMDTERERLLNLRRKLEPPGQPTLIQTVRGVGFLLKAGAIKEPAE